MRSASNSETPWQEEVSKWVKVQLPNIMRQLTAALTLVCPRETVTTWTDEIWLSKGKYRLTHTIKLEPVEHGDTGHARTPP